MFIYGNSTQWNNASVPAISGYKAVAIIGVGAANDPQGYTKLMEWKLNISLQKVYASWASAIPSSYGVEITLLYAHESLIS